MKGERKFGFGSRSAQAAMHVQTSDARGLTWAHDPPLETEERVAIGR